MTGGFNPYRAGLPPQAQNISQDLISKLMGGGTESMQALLGGIQKSGEISRSSKLNNLLATGGLNGLTEDQTRQKVAQMTGGQSVNPLVQANIEDVMSNQKASEIAKSKAAADLGLAEYKFGNDMTKTKYESGQKSELEQLKSQLGLQSDLTLEDAKAKNDMKSTNALFGNQASLVNLKHQLNVDSAKKGELPDKWGVLGNGVLYNKTSGETMMPEEYKKIAKTKDIMDSLPNKAETYVKSLSPNQRKNWEKTYRNGNLAWQDEVTEKVLNKAGLVTDKVISNGRFVDLDNPTAAWVTFPNKVKEEDK